MQYFGPRLALIVFSMTVLCSVGTTAAADAKDDAKTHFDNGTQMMELEDFSGAAAEFQTSLSLYRTSSALFNLAMCFKAQHRYPEALDSFRALLSEFGSKLTEDTRKEVHQNISSLSKIIAEVEVVVNVSGATVTVDGVSLGTTPLAAPVRVGAGKRRISVSKAGYATAEEAIQIAAGAKEVVRFELQVETGPAPVVTSASAVTPASGGGYSQDNPDPEMIAVENALGRPMYRDYTRYERGPASRKMGFVEYEYRLLKKKRNKGIVLSCVLTPVFWGIGTGLFVALQTLAADQRNDINSVADGSGAEAGSWLLFGLFAAAGTATVTVGALNWGLSARKMRKLKPAYNQYVEGVAPTPEGGAAVEPAAEPAPETPAPAPEARLQLGLAPLFDRLGTPAGAALALSF